MRYRTLKAVLLRSFLFVILRGIIVILEERSGGLKIIAFI